jgi:hypothetical protein
MTAIIEWIGSGLIKILDMFKNPELVKPEPKVVEVEEAIDERLIPSEVERKEFPKTLGDLLDNIEATFDAYKTPSFNSWVTNDERIGLKKLGAHVPNPWLFKTYEHGNLKVSTTAILPAFMLISLDARHTHGTNSISPSFMYAVKQKAPPWFVQKKRGTVYKVGAAYFLRKLYWACGWLVVKDDGTVELCKEHRVDPITIKKGKHKGYSYNKKVYDVPDMCADWEDGEHRLKEIFLNLFDWWVTRNLRWNVTVKKNGDRVTFCVDKELTKKYFADRDKSVKTQSGQTKRIIHFVKEHERKYGDKIRTVKEHIRGLNKFTWKGYQCIVSAPEFGMRISSAMFQNAPDVELEEGEVREGYVSMSKVGLMLAQDEEQRAER